MTSLFCNRWWVVFATICGLLVGAGPINVFTFGVFLKPITEDLGPRGPPPRQVTLPLI